MQSFWIFGLCYQFNDIDDWHTDSGSPDVCPWNRVLRTSDDGNDVLSDLWSDSLLHI